MSKLTPKQRMFVEQYLIDLNATQAYKRAGYSAKTDRVAGVESHKLLKNPKIEAAIAKAMDERSKRTEVTADRVLQELAKVGFSNITDFMEWQNGDIRLKDSSEIDGAVIQEVSESTLANGTTNFSFKLHNKMDALKSLGKHLGMFDKQQEDQTDVVDEWVEAMSDE